MMRYKAVHILIITLGLLCACNSAAQVGVTQTGDNLKGGNTITPPYIPFATASSSGVNEAADFRVVRNCLNEQSLASGNLMTAGSLIYYDDSDKSVKTLQPSSLETQTLFDEFQLFEISPSNGTLFWFQENTKADFYLPTGEILEFNIPRNLYFGRWLRDGRVQLGVGKALYENDEKGPGSIDEFYLLSPTTGELTYHTVSLPIGLWLKNNYAIYDPDLKLVFISGQEGSLFQSAIWDIEHKKVIWDDFQTPEDSLPDWKLDGSEAIQVGYTDPEAQKPELVLIDRNGNSRILTQLSTAITEPYYMYSPTWSPDGRYIAFYIKFLDRPLHDGPWLYIFDIRKNEVLDFCVHTRLESHVVYRNWSPDGEHLSFLTADEPGIVILDVETGQAQRILGVREDAILRLIGWVPWDMH